MAQESRYSKVFVKIWHSKDFRTLSEEGKMLFLYLLTSPHRNMGGFYYLPLPYLCFDIGLDEKRVSKAFEELTDKDMALYDFDAQVVLIKKWFCYNPIENENQAKGLNKQLAEIPKSRLFKPFENCVKEYCKYIESILKGLDIPSDNPSETLSKPFTKPGTGTGTGTEEETEQQLQDTSTESVASIRDEGSKPVVVVDNEKDSAKEVFRVFENEIGIVSPIISEKLIELTGRYPPNWVTAAIREAVRQNKRKLSYVEGILENWKRNGYGNGPPGTGLKREPPVESPLAKYGRVSK